ncbi:hypothetical protein [Hyphobacterium marinum]|uniref:Uncharacterized protein n=1 Tax=Hyphobacterium marinum TaxID=3116574 RepID=A0ABU7LV62_9PROT|nr:hypothetical protein [Hyphobacterium sp. Y6023]MEE2565060.1 hypothetical protein [Hyphobacterium sp. Y6023]
MKTLTLSLFSAALLLGSAAMADHHGDSGHGAPTADECEALQNARNDAMESGEPMSDEDRRRLEMCERGIEMEHGGGDGHGDDHHDEDDDHGDHGDHD